MATTGFRPRLIPNAFAFALVAAVTLSSVPTPAASIQGLYVEAIGRWSPGGGRGYAHAVDVDGSIAYFGEGRFLKVLDTTDPANPMLLASLGLPDDVREIARKGTYLYLATALAGLTIVDISDMTEPVQVGSWDTSGWCLAVAVAGDLAYVGDYSTGLRVIDVGDPTQPFEVGFWDTPGSARGVAVSGNLAYVADGAAGLRIVDVSQPATPHEVGYWDEGWGELYDVAVVGNLAYLADAQSGLRILDVHDPNAPFEVGSAGGTAISVAIEGNLAYVAGYHQLRSIDVTDPAAPFEVNNWPVGYAADVKVEGSLVFVVQDGLRIIDVSDSTYGGVRLQRAALGGSNAETVVQTTSGARGIALDPLGGKIYWGVDSCPSNSKIMRSDLDGSNVEVLLNGLDHVMDLALDFENEKIYWSGSKGCTELVDLYPTIQVSLNQI